MGLWGDIDVDIYAGCHRSLELGHDTRLNRLRILEQPLNFGRGGAIVVLRKVHLGFLKSVPSTGLYCATNLNYADDLNINIKCGTHGRNTLDG